MPQWGVWREIQEKLIAIIILSGKESGKKQLCSENGKKLYLMNE
jgi:hypothetical protein